MPMPCTPSSVDNIAGNSGNKVMGSGWGNEGWYCVLFIAL